MNRTLTCCLLMLSLCSANAWPQPSPVDVGSRLQLFADGLLVEQIKGEARLQLQRPTPREVVLVTKCHPR